jgi:hypothetical protein
LALVILYEIHDINRFPTVQDFVSLDNRGPHRCYAACTRSHSPRRFTTADS